MNNKPLITIVTVCFNAVNVIEKTIESVLNQTYNNLEYLIIDGGSDDGTLNIIKEYKSKFNNKISFITESDEGIYDAMNKGANLANGEWIYFLNAGDRLLNPKVLSTIFDNQNISDFDLIYGDVKVDYNKFNKLKKAKPLNELWKGMVFSHQAVFIRTKLIINYQFNIENNIVADYELVINLYKDGYEFYYFEQPLALISCGGVSDINRIEVIFDYYKTYTNYFKLNYVQKIYYLINFIINYIKIFIKKAIPNKLKYEIIKMIK